MTLSMCLSSPEPLREDRLPKLEASRKDRFELERSSRNVEALASIGDANQVRQKQRIPMNSVVNITPEERQEARDWESTFRAWAKPSSDTEAAKSGKCRVGDSSGYP